MKTWAPGSKSRKKGHLGGLVECLTLAFHTGHDLGVAQIEPWVGSPLSMGSAWDSLPPLPPLTHMLSHWLSLK